jgi:CHAT domain-containing protein
VHFAGHGDFGWRCEDEACGYLATAVAGDVCTCGRPFPSGRTPSGFLAFTRDDTGQAHWIDAEGLRVALSGGNVQLAVLNTCKSGRGRRGGDIFNGIAQRLMDKVPAVVASPYPLDNQGALEFARCLYEELGNGHPLADALHHVRTRMFAAFPNEWYRPVLYLLCGLGGRRASA